MRAGKLNARVVVERPEVTRDDMGSELITWVKVATVWAHIAPIVPARGREAEVANQLQDQADTRITIRWSDQIDGMSAKWRLRFATLRNPIIYNIATPPAQLDMGQRTVVIICKSGVNEGQ